MNKMSIHGAEYPIQKIFCDDFVFTIPLYQRAYAWTTEESEELFQDLIRAMDGYEESIDDAPPYFLGSIVLIKGDDPDAQVVDGQQRLKDLERLVVSFMIRKTPPHKRIDRYCELLNAIYEKQDLYASNSPLQLTSGECHEVLRILNGNMYLMHYLCRYVLLRLDAELSEGTASYEYQTISIEHVLPQRPSPNSDWLKSFPTEQAREKYVHRLGNLVLLSRGKNIEAENYDFDLKKEKYFSTKTGVSSFVLTTHVLRCREWTPAVIDQRQNQLMDILKHLWRL